MAGLDLNNGYSSITSSKQALLNLTVDFPPTPSKILFYNINVFIYSLDSFKLSHASS